MFEQTGDTHELAKVFTRMHSSVQDYSTLLDSFVVSIEVVQGPTALANRLQHLLLGARTKRKRKRVSHRYNESSPQPNQAKR